MQLPSFASNNRTYTQGLAILPAAAGSAISVLIVVASVWAAISLTLRRYPFRYVRTDRYIVVAGLFYTAVMIASIVFHMNHWKELGEAVTPLIYVAPALLIPRYRLTPEVDCFDVFVRAAPWCGIVALPLIAYQALHGMRVEGGAGNAYPFAMICTFLGPVALMNLREQNSHRALLAVAGFLACAFGVIVAETRTAWLAFAVNLVVIGWYLAPSAPFRRNRRLAAVAAVVLAGIVFATAGPVAHRAELLVHDVQVALEGGVPGESVAARIGLWAAAAEAIKARPLTGYGAQHRRDIIHDIVIPVTKQREHRQVIETLSYSHFHNGFLTGMIDAGILGLLATVMLLFSPLALAFAAPRDENYRRRIAFALFLFWTYAVTGSFNIMFGQDLIDALYVTGLVMLALSVRNDADREGSGRIEIRP